MTSRISKAPAPGSSGRATRESASSLPPAAAPSASSSTSAAAAGAAAASRAFLDQPALQALAALRSAGSGKGELSSTAAIKAAFESVSPWAGPVRGEVALEEHSQAAVALSGAAYHLIRCGLFQGLSVEEFKQLLVTVAGESELLKKSAEVILEEFKQRIAARGKKEGLGQRGKLNETSLPRLVKLNWRVDVSISTNLQARVFKPIILMKMTLSDGSIHSFECPIEKFHQLRHAVAKSLNEVYQIEQHPIFKIASSK